MFDFPTVTETVRVCIEEHFPVVVTGATALLALAALALVPGLASALLQLGVLAAALFALQFLILAAIAG